MVLEEDVPKDANMITGSFVVTIKDVETGKPTFKARFVARGNRDSDKDQLIYNSRTILQSSARLLVAIAATTGFDVWTEDISQAYLQSASELQSEVCLKPNRKLRVPAGYVLKFLRTFCGLADSGDYRHATFAKNLSDDLAMKPVASDMSLFFRRARGKVTGLLPAYVYDTLACGNDSFAKLTKRTRETFEVKSREHNNRRFSGVYFDKLRECFEIHQRAYVDRLKNLPRDADFTQLRKSRAELSWLVHSRSDICVTASKLALVTEKTFERNHLNMFNTAANYLVESRGLSLQMRKLNMDSLHIRAYADGSFATNHNLTLQLGYIVLICGKWDNACTLHYACYKSRRVARSFLGTETYAFADAYDFAYCAKKDLETILDRTDH